MSRMLNQNDEAARFVQYHQDEVDGLLKASITAGRRFVQVYGTSLQIGACLKLSRYLDLANAEGFMLHLRGYASEFAGMQRKATYWNLIDALGALCDAIGASWPYMNVDVRSARLVHAQELLDETGLLLTEC